MRDEQETRKNFTRSEKIILVGHILNALGVTLLGIGSLLRSDEIPVTPIFNSGQNQTPVNTPITTYWNR